MKPLLILFIFISPWIGAVAQKNFGVLDTEKVIQQMHEYQLIEKIKTLYQKTLEDSSLKLQYEIEKHLRNIPHNNQDSKPTIKWSNELNEMNKHFIFFTQTYYTNKLRELEQQQIKTAIVMLKYQLLGFMEMYQLDKLIDMKMLAYIYESEDYTQRAIDYLKLYHTMHKQFPDNNTFTSGILKKTFLRTY